MNSPTAPHSSAPLIWNPAATPAELHSMLTALAEEYPIRSGREANVVFLPDAASDCLRVTREDGRYRIHYCKPNLAARGVAHALAGEEAEEMLNFDTFGILLDASRNAVITVAAFRHWLRRLALFGYNCAMIYTKSAYTLPGEPYFGYMQGAYTAAELKAIDAYAKELNITMIASIQALGHLEPILRWESYAAYRDTESVMLADYEPGYRLIAKMLDFWSSVFSARRIHLGMDETWGLGTGRYLRLHGYERAFDIYNRHLARVVGLCRERQLQPMIWSDMYFRLGSVDDNYYDPASVVPEDVKNAIPGEVDLAYWDYYHTTPEFYENFIARHRALGKNPVMASGIWTWSRLWYDHRQTVQTAGPCMTGCRQARVRELIFTMWGDDGNYCEFDSAFAGLAWCADFACRPETIAESERAPRLEAIMAAVCGASFQRQLVPSTLSEIRCDETGRERYRIHGGALLWDDPLMAIVQREIEFYGGHEIPDYITRLKTMRDTLAPWRGDEAAGHLGHAWNLADALIRKLEFRARLHGAYRNRDTVMLARLAAEEVPAVIAAIDAVNESFRQQWLRNYKPQGLELMQIRLAGLCERYRETARRIAELNGGRIGCIEELEPQPPAAGHLPSQYHRIATGNWQL